MWRTVETGTATYDARDLDARNSLTSTTADMPHSWLPITRIGSTLQYALSELSPTKPTALQWIPSHCDIRGNEEADSLSKAGSKIQQFRHPISYPEIKTLIQHKIRQEWCHQHNITGEDTSLMDLERWQQTIIFRLRIASKCHHQWNVPVAQEHKTQKTYYKNVLHTPSREHALGQYQWTLETSYGEPNVNWSTPHSSSGTYKSWSTVFERRRRRSIQQISDECARRGH